MLSIFQSHERLQYGSYLALGYLDVLTSSSYAIWIHKAIWYSKE